MGFSLTQVIYTGLKQVYHGQQATVLLDVFICVHVCVASLQGYRRPNYKELATDQARYQRWLLKHECKAFYTPVFAEDLKQGTQYLLQVGTLKQTSPAHQEATPRPRFPKVYAPPSSECDECNVTLVFRLRDWAVSSPTPWCWASKTTGGMVTWWTWRPTLVWSSK